MKCGRWLKDKIQIVYLCLYILCSFLPKSQALVRSPPPPFLKLWVLIQRGIINLIEGRNNVSTNSTRPFNNQEKPTYPFGTVE
jgi:hypothetical protein